MSGISIRGYEREVKRVAPRAVKAASRPPRWIISLIWLRVSPCVMRMAMADDEVLIRHRYCGSLKTVGDQYLPRRCIGHAGPSVAFESGMGGFSLA